MPSFHRASGPYPDTPLSIPQRHLLGAMQTTAPKKVLVCYRQRDGRWSPSVFRVMGGKVYPCTMDALWRRGLVQYSVRRGGDRWYSLTKMGRGASALKGGWPPG